jgi:calcyphosin
VHNYSSKNRSQNLHLEKEGKITGDLPTKFQEDQNIFYFVTSPGAQYQQPVEDLNRFTIDDLIREIKTKIVDRSSTGGIRGMARIFKAMDNNGNGLLDVDDFRWGLMDYGISVSKDEASQVLKHFDRDGNGQVDFTEFIRSIRGDLNAVRARVVRAAYDKLDVNRDGSVKLDDIAKLYDVSSHPEVVSGQKAPEAVYLSFMSMWDTQERDAIVTFGEFSEYYADMGASIDDDEYFVAVVKAAWRL